MSKTQRGPRLNRLTAWMVVAGCIAGPVMAQTVIIGDATIEVIDAPDLLPFSTLILGENGGDGTLTFASGVLEIGNGLTDQLVVGRSGIGTLLMSGGTLNVLNQDLNIGAFIVGENAGGSGTFTQTGGDVFGGRSLTIASNGGSGVYNLDSGSNPTLNVSILTIGYSGSGTFNQQADTTVTTSNIFLGTDHGIYNQSGGSLSVLGGQGTIVGTFNFAEFNQSGGTHHTSELIVGNQSFASATYNLSGGSLSVDGDMLVGRGQADVAPGVAGLFRQTGGDVVTNTLWIGGDTRVPGEEHYGRGRYELVDGTVTSQLTLVGNISPGSVLQTGGTFIAGVLQVGRSGSFTESGSVTEASTYDLQGGQLNTTGTTLSLFGMATFNHSGGDHNVGGHLVIGSEAAFVDPFPALGPVLEGIYNLSGGVLTVVGNTILGSAADARGTVNQSGGVATLTGNLDIAFGANSTGFYSLTGIGQLTVGGDVSVGRGGVGVFTQNGIDTANAVSGVLYLGGSGVFDDTAATHGTYNLQAGTLTTGATWIGQAMVGVFNQSGGAHQTGNLLLGNAGGAGVNSDGTYNLSDGQLTVLGEMTVSGFGRGAFNQSGGTATVGTNLIVGSGPAVGGSPTREGFVNLTGGSLTVSGDTIIGRGNGVGADPGFAGEPGALGTFIQSGGAHLVGGNLKIGQSGYVAGGTGHYTLSSGILTVTGNTFIGGSGLPDGLVDGVGTFTHTGGTHTTSGDMYIGGGQGTYNLGGTAVLNTGITYLSSGNGQFNQTAGTHNAGYLNVYGGAYALSGGSVNVAGNMGVGGPFNSATFTQSGGDVFVNDPTFGLFVGGFGGSGETGTYTLSNGSLTVVATTHVGSDAVGTFEQTGGTHTTTRLVLGENLGGTGTYHLNGGDLIALSIVSINPQGGSQGVLNVAGGSLTAPLVVNNDRVNYSGGSLTANVANDAQFNVSGGAARALTGDLSNNSGGTLSVAAATPLTISGVLTQAATGASIVAGANITVGKDYNNLGAGSGNSFDRRANVSGAGQIVGQNAAQTITGDAIGAANTWTLNLGNVRGGSGPVTKNYQVANSGTGADIRGAIQTTGLGNITDGRLSGTGVTASNFGPLVAGANSGNLSVTLTGPGAALSGQKVAIVSNFDNVATQVITLSGGAVSALAVGSATPSGATPATAVDLGNFRVGSAGAVKNFDVQNLTTGGGAEQLGINGVIATAGFTGANAFGAGLVGPGATQLGAVTARADATGTAGIRIGTVTVNYATDGTAIDASFTRQAANNQVINVQATGWNLANGVASPAGPINLGNFHVGLAGGAAPQNSAIDIANNAPNLGFTEQLKVGSAGVTGAFALTNNIGGALISAGATSVNALNVARNGGAAGVNTGTLTIQYQSDGTGAGNSGFAAIDVNSQQITVNAAGYRLAQANTIAAVNFGNVHVGDTVSQALGITNTQIADSFSEKLNASFGSVSDARITTSGTINLLAAGQSDNSSMLVGLNTAAAGTVNGTARVLLKSDGTGTSGLGLTDLPPQDVGVSGDITLSGSVFRLASASPVAPNPVNFGNVRINSATDQALTLTNTAVNDGFSEKLNASIGGATAGVTSNNGSFTLLGPQDSNSSSLRVGLDTTSAGAKSGTAAITLVSDGTGTSGLGQTPLASQTVTISGNVFRLATGDATPAPLDLGNFRLSAATASGSLDVKNAAAADGYSEQLGIQSVGTSNALFTASNVLGTNRINAQATRIGAVTVSLGSGLAAGVNNGSVAIQYLSDGTATGTGAAIASNLQNVGVTATGFNAAVGAASPDPIVMHRRVNDVATQVLTVSNNAAAGNFSEALNAAFSGATGAASHNGGSVGNLVAGGANSAAMAVSLNTASAGAKSGTVTLSYETDGSGPNGKSGLAAAAAGTQTITISGNVYTTAVAAVAPTSINFGIVHVGDVVADRTVSASNIAAVTALNDRLTGGIGGATGPFNASGTLGSGVAAGQTDNSSLRVGLNTATAGVYAGAGAGSANVSLQSHNADMADLALGSTAIELLAQVNNYANIDLTKSSGGGSLGRSGNSFTLDFGNVAQGSGVLSASLNALNDVFGPADVADGSFCLPGQVCNTLDSLLDFALAGFDDFDDLVAGATAGPMTVGFDTTNLGFFADAIVLNWFGHNDSGYADSLRTFTLNIRGSVVGSTGGSVPEPGNLLLVLTALLLLAGSGARRSRHAAAGRSTVQAAVLAA